MASTTLLITTLNRGRLLQNNLERLTQLTLPDEILVVDDGGNDDTEGVCQSFGDRLPIRYIYNDNPGPSICSFARNIGVRQSVGDLVITAEPEIVFRTDVIAQFKQLHETHPGQVISAGSIFFARGDQVPWESAHPASADFQHEVGWVATYAALYAREWLFEVGGWDEAFPGSWGWDDTDLLTRLRLAGHGQVIEREAEVVHQWHPLGADVDSVNERYFFSKSFHHDPSDRSEMVANQGVPWGTLRTKIS